jgi:cytochrome c
VTDFGRFAQQLGDCEPECTMNGIQKNLLRQTPLNGKICIAEGRDEMTTKKGVCRMKVLQLAAAMAIAAMSVAPFSAQAQDAAAGASLFGGACASCHSTESGGASSIGPNLFGVTGSIASNRGIDFDYSDSLIDSGIIWDAGNLDAWLESPSDFVPGNKMPFPGIAGAADRADIIAYLATLK